MSATNNVSNLFDFGIYSSPKLTKSEEKLIDGKLKDGDEVFYYCAKCHKVGRTQVKYYSAGKVCNSCQVKRHDEKDEKELISEYASDIRRVAKDLGRVPTSKEYNQLGRYPLSRLGQVFQKSWKEILASLGYCTGKKEVSYQEVANHLKHISQQLNKLPTLKEYQELGKIDVDIIKRVTKADNWTEVLATVFHLPEEIVEQAINPFHEYYQEQLSKIKSIAEKLNRVPSANEAVKYGIDVDLISKRLSKNWIELLKLAGVDVDIYDVEDRNVACSSANNSNNSGCLSNLNNPNNSNNSNNSSNPSNSSSTNNANYLTSQSHLSDLSKRIIRDREMLDDLNRVAKELGYYPDKLKYTQLGAYSASNLLYRFNLNWVGIIDLAKGRELVVPSRQTIRRAKTCLHQTILEYFSIPMGTRR